MMRGKFIVFEGIDGSGKTSQIRRLEASLNSVGHKTFVTREPTDLPIGQLIRKVIEKEITVPRTALAALFAADRIDHVHHKDAGLQIMLESGVHVLCDRYYFSSLAYHSLDMSMDWVIELNRKAMQALKADVTVFLDVSAEQSMQRIDANRSGTDLFEKKETLEAVRKNYIDAFQRFPQETVLWIDAEQKEATIAESLWQHLRSSLIY